MLCEVKVSAARNVPLGLIMDSNTATVRRVIAGTAADLAGFCVGDVVLAVNYNLLFVSAYTVYKLRALLQAAHPLFIVTVLRCNYN